MKNNVQLLMAVAIVLLLGVAIFEARVITRTNELIESERGVFSSRLIALEEELVKMAGGSVRPKIGPPPSVCFECHDELQTKGFHDVDRILKLQDKNEMRRRICTNCHGPPLNPQEPVPDADEPYPGDNSHPHRIHQRKLDLKVIYCDTCHVYDGDFRYPKPRSGQLVVCELCHGSNLIDVHVAGDILPDDAMIDVIWKKDGEQHSCVECHMGDIMGIHKEATTKLGVGELGALSLRR
ncbi:MAG: hypothetical protein V3V92_05110 [Candidatus Hydrothermarchaeales archaeon]